MTLMLRGTGGGAMGVRGDMSLGLQVNQMMPVIKITFQLTLLILAFGLMMGEIHGEEFVSTIKKVTSNNYYFSKFTMTISRHKQHLEVGEG